MTFREANKELNKELWHYAKRPLIIITLLAMLILFL